MAFILLVDVSADLFKACFGATEEWPCDIRTLSSEDDSDASQLKTMLTDPNLLCVVVENMDTHWNVVKENYNGGGFVAYFGIYGEFNAPSALSAELGLKWRFSGYTREEYEVTDVGIQHLGDIGGITTQQYTKSNLISAPAEDRIMVGKKYATIKEYLTQCEGIPEEEIFDDPNKMHPDYREDYQSAKTTGYPRHCETMDNQSPLVMHVNKNGGKIAYLGFVNGDGNIPTIVRALLAGEKQTAG